ncbi:MAG: hypothetical protein J6R20_00820 [Clostridia bacterium]|nr:hypothetical protein [Clostridia bacterium]
MKKTTKLISILLVLAMLLSMAPIALFTASAALTPAALGGCDGNHSGYTALSQSGWSLKITQPGNYYIKKDWAMETYEPTLVIECSGTVTVCLNSYDLYHTGNSSRVVYIYATGGDLTVNLCDCKGTGEIYHNNTKTGINLYGDKSNGYYATLNMYGGTIRDCSSGINESANTRFNMYGGTIKGCSYYGVIQSESDGKVNIYGGSIINNNEGIRVCSADAVTLTGSPVITGNTNGDLYFRQNNSPIIAKNLIVNEKITIAQYTAKDCAVVKVDSEEAYDYFEALDPTARTISHNDNTIWFHGDHLWKDANCTEPKTCQSCGMTEGEALGHDWKEATCTAPETCSVCGGTQGEVAPHAYNTYTIISEAKCGLNAKETASCDYGCGTTDTREIEGTALTHSFTYSASGNTITAECANGVDCPNPQSTLTISAPADLYADGTTAKEATVENNLVDTSVAVSEVTYSTADGKAPKTTGTYTASVTVGGATASVEFTLLNYAAKVTDKDGNELEGSPFKTLEEAADAVRWDYENATITLLDDITLDSTWSVGGVVTIDLNGKTLNCTSGDTIFVQALKGFAVTVEDSSENKTGVIRSETGSAIDVGVGSKFILNSGTITAENDYAIMAVYSASSHSLFEVNGGTVNGMVFCYADSVVSGGTFNDMFAVSYYNKQNKFSGGIFNGGIKITSLDPLNELLADGYYFRNAQGKVVDGSSEIIEEKVTIEKGADFSADAVVTAEDVVYNGAAQEPDVTVTIGGKILTEGKDYTIAFADNINAGTATVTVTSAGDYEGEIVKTFEIKKADSLIEVYPEANKLTYNGEAQTLVVIGDTNDGMIVYSLDGEKYSPLPPTGTNAGEYTVYYKVEGDSNHNDTETETVIATIEKKAVSVSATVPDRIYGDDYQVDTSKVVVTFDGIVDGDNVGYVVIDAYYHAHTVTDSAPVQVVYNVNGADTDNYQFPEYGDWMAPNYGVQATGKVLPRDISDAQIVLGDALIYNGTEQTQSIASVTVIGKDVTYDISDNTATNVGVYELTITGNGNFTGTKTVLFEVAPDTSAIDALTVDNVKSTDKEAIEAVAKQIKNAVTDLASDEKKAEYKAIADKCNELLAKIDATADEIARIDEAVNGYDIETVTSADIPALGKLIEDIKALTDGDNLTEDEKAVLEANDESIDELVAKLTEVAEEIKRVDEAVKSYDEATVRSPDKADLEQLKEEIQVLIDSTNTTENEKTALEDMIKNIEGLEDKIAETEEKLEEIKGIENNYNPETVTSDDKAAIKEKIAEIEAVNPDNLTDEQKAEYDEIKAGFEALLEEIEKAGSEVDSIGAELEALDEKRVTVFWKDEIEALKAKIDELLTNDNMGEAEKARLNEYKAQCDNLIEIINTPVKYFSMRLFYLVWDALNWIINRIASVF